MFTEEQAMALVEKATNIAFNFFTDKKYDEAEVVLNQVLKVNPDNGRAMQLRGLIRHNTGRHEEAIEFFKQALDLDPDNAENHNNISLCYSNLGLYEEAMPHLNRAVTLAPECSYMLSNMGLLHRNMRNYVDAISYFVSALSLKPDDPGLWCMLGGSHAEYRQLPEAEKCFRKAIDLDPVFSAAHVDLANVYFLQNNNAAWAEYEWRHEHFDQTKFWRNLYDCRKKWSGESLEGKKIIIHSEQGMGDFIQFFRYVPLLKKEGAYVIVHCPAAIESLVLPHVDEVYTTDPGEIPLFGHRSPDFPLPQYDYFASVMSLTYLLNVPPVPGTPYLHTQRRINVANYSDYIKVGIVWAGNPQHPNDTYRSCRLDQFRSIQNLPGVKLFSLQADKRMRKYRLSKEPVDLMAGCDDMKIVDMAEHMGSFEDTAAILKSLDLLISVDTATLHLAGALDVPAYGLIPYNTDWRWGLEGDKTQWYSSLRLFRQPVLGDWDTPFEQIRRDLYGRISTRNRQKSGDLFG